ncbi:MAG TPA: NAD(P)H-dependent oxidoreductase [Mesorhizobium sp.]|jgi:putative NADPH-quinone reductase|nr:NAD(P)H-dependent oxidoreductase [Mesorhizobium sp.]
MRVLVVYCHPVPESFCAALRDTCLAALAAGGHEARLLDLYAEGFNPAMNARERRTYNDGPPADPVLLAHGEHLHWAEGLLFVYPTWWYGLPAMLKGWLERVWAVDIAFGLAPDGGRIKPKLQNIRRLGVVTTCGATWLVSKLIGEPGRKTLLRGMRPLFSPRCRSFYLAHYDMDRSTPESRRAYLEKVRATMGRFGATSASPSPLVGEGG